MAYYVVGDTISESFTLNTLMTGQTFTRVASYQAGSAVVWNPTFTEIGSGSYRWSYVTTTSSTLGNWEWVGTSSSSGETVTINFDLNATEPTIVIAAATSGALTQTLAQLRARVAKRLGDYVLLTATSNGTTSTFIDALNVNSATENMKGRIMLLSDSGEVVRITAQVDGTSTLTFTPVAASASSTNTSSLAEVFNKRGKGFTPAEYRDAINAAITDAFPLGMIRVRASVVAAFDYDAPEVTVPAAMTHVEMVEYEDSDGKWHSVPKGTNASEYGWVVDAAAGQLRILGEIGYGLDGLTLRLSGYGRQETLTADSDTCALNSEWIVARACAHLCLAGLDKDDRYGQLAGAFMNESDKLRVRLRSLKTTAQGVRAA